VAGRDLYVLLGIQRHATGLEIARAYRRAARSSHPDLVPADPSAAERFKVLTDAYETLSDPARRAAYDRSHPLADAATHAVETRGASVVTSGPAESGAGLFVRRAPLWAGPVHVSPPGSAARALVDPDVRLIVTRRAVRYLRVW